MQLISKFNNGNRFSLCVIDIFSTYAWVIFLKDKKGITIVNVFKKIFDNLTRKPNKVWVDKGIEFDNSYFIKLLKYNVIEMYSIHNKGKSVVAERFIRTLKNKTSISKNVHIDKLDNIVDESNKTYSTIKMKSADVKSRVYIDFGKKSKIKIKIKSLNLELMTM